MRRHSWNLGAEAEVGRSDKCELGGERGQGVKQGGGASTAFSTPAAAVALRRRGFMSPGPKVTSNQLVTSKQQSAISKQQTSKQEARSKKQEASIALIASPSRMSPRGRGPWPPRPVVPAPGVGAWRLHVAGGCTGDARALWTTAARGSGRGSGQGTTAAFLIRFAARRNSAVLPGLKPNC
jgi:hypothetical protein